MDAELVLGLCDRFHCLPSQLDEEGAELIKMVEIVRRGTPQESSETEGEG